MNKALIVDASASDNRVMANLLVKAGYDPVVVESIETGKQAAVELPPGAVIVTAMRLPDGTARELINWLKCRGVQSPVIVILETFNAMEVYEIMKNHGAVDVVQRAALDKCLVDTVEKYAPNHIVSETSHRTLFKRQSVIYRTILDKVEKVAHTNLNILVVGESGVGKEPIAEEIHRRSSRKDKPCLILDASVLHLQDYGKKILYEGLRSKLLKVVGGTVIIDHIHMISPEIRHIISDIIKSEQYDVRFITLIDSTHHPPRPSKNVSSYLRYKLSQYVIDIPPLRVCSDDIIPLTECFLTRYKQEFRLDIKGFDNDAKKKLLAHPWPGNIRELKNAIRIAAIEAQYDIITSEDLHLSNVREIENNDFKLYDEQTEKAKIIAALTTTNGIMKEAAKRLGINRNTLRNKIIRYGIDVRFE